MSAPTTFSGPPPEAPVTPSRRRLGRWLRQRSWTASAAVALGLVVLAAAGGLLALPGSPARDWIVRVHPPITALSFAGADHLPHEVVPGQSLRVTFVVTRSGGGTARTTWRARFLPASGAPLDLGAGTISLVGGRPVQERVVTTAPAALPGRLVITLGSGQSVDLLLERASG